MISEHLGLSWDFQLHIFITDISNYNTVCIFLIFFCSNKCCLVCSLIEINQNYSFQISFCQFIFFISSYFLHIFMSFLAFPIFNLFTFLFISALEFPITVSFLHYKHTNNARRVCCDTNTSIELVYKVTTHRLFRTFLRFRISFGYTYIIRATLKL